MAASFLLHAVPLALRAEPASAQLAALTPSELVIVAEVESAAVGPGPSLSELPAELPAAAAVAPAPARQPVARRAAPRTRPEPVREASPEPAPDATASETASVPQPLVAAQVAAPEAAALEVPASPASDSSGSPANGGALAPGGQRAAGAGSAPALAVSGRPASAGMDAGALRQRYLRELRQRVLERREYPHAAQRAGLQGVVCLRLSLTASGHLSELRATCRPPPEPLLQAALRAVRAAEPFPPLPSEIGSQLSVDLPIVFQLDER